MIRLLLALFAIIGLFWLAAWLRKSSPTQRVYLFKMILLYGVAGFLLVMVLTGRIHWLFALVSATVPWIQRYFFARQAWRMFKSNRKPIAGNTSKVETRYFVMILDHDSGELTGNITQGDFSGKNISDLSLEQLLTLLQECRSDDPQSAALLEAFLDRYHGDTWRTNDFSDEPHRQASVGPMSRREAAEILGLDENSASEEVIETHRRLMQKLHSDRGGTDYLASLVNQARDVLLED